MQSASASNHPNLLILTRTISFLAISFLLLFYGISDGKVKFFFYLTHWGMMITFTFFFLSLLNYFIDFINTPTCIFFLIAWGFNWIITLLFWGYLVPADGLKTYVRGISIHSLPLILTLIDFSQNKIQFERRWFIIVLIFMLCYLFAMLIPYTLEIESIYYGITFQNVHSFIIVVVAPLVLIVFLELGKLVRSCIDSKQTKDERELPLLDIDRENDNEEKERLVRRCYAEGETEKV